MQRNRFIKDLLYPILIGAALMLVASLIFLFFREKVSEPDLNTFLFVQGGTYAFILIVVCLTVLNRVLNRFLPWRKYAGTRFLLQMLLGTSISLCILNSVYTSIKEAFTQMPADAQQIVLLNILGAIIILPLFSFYFGYKFLKDWRKSELESEQLLKENVRSQLLSLRNHLDPHFLFNNLNILSSLMEKDLDLSKSYLNKFAEVYRVILKTEYSDLTTLEDELKLIESYVYLLKIRFQESVFFHVDVDNTAKLMALPPLSVQMLIENAIKHNVATKDKPINIEVSNEGSYLLVTNNLQKKKYLPSERKATGIDNIKKRYEFFSDMVVLVEETEDTFTVKLPLIEIEYADKSIV